MISASHFPPRIASQRGGPAGGVSTPPHVSCHFILIGGRPHHWFASNRNSERSTHHHSALNAIHYGRQYFRDVSHAIAPLAGRDR